MGASPLPRESAYVFVNERGDPFKREGIGRMIERWRGHWAAVPRPRSYVDACLRLCPCQQGNGYQKAPTLLGPRQYHEHCSV